MIPPSAIIIGAGPAGLMAAEVLAARGVSVQVFDAMPTAARKLLMAGKGGLNITHSEPLDAFLGRYGARRAELEPVLRAFNPQALRDWIHGLGIPTFVGSSGRVFPEGMKAAPLLRAWLHRLRQTGVRFHMRHRWLGWTADGGLRFETPAGERIIHAEATLLALGGGSWQKLGSDGAWVDLLEKQGVPVAPLKPANCGFDGPGWSGHFSSRHAGQPLKSVAATVADGDGQTIRRKGECLITATGLEGGLIYALSAILREQIETQGSALLHLDLLPDHSAEKVAAEVARPRGARSLSSHLQSRLGLSGAKAGLLREVLDKDSFQNPARLAAAIKSLPIRLLAPRPLDEAISSAGGVTFEALDNHLMLRAHPGLFCAGEMLDWEAPTGGYLLTACLATGRAAGVGIADWLSGQAPGPTANPGQAPEC